MPKEAELLAEIQRLKSQLDQAQKKVKSTRYGIVWMDIPETFENNGEVNIPVLREVKENTIQNDDVKPTHLIIEGDNYHALSCLKHSHEGLIDLIYIDPPYNTGSVEFCYEDKRILKKYPDGTGVPKDHPFRHSEWLSFMSKRLKIAHSLLKEEGTIFISINEEEYARLKLLCDGIFQESNYLTTFTVKIRHEDRILKGDKDYHETTEQLLLYRKSRKFKTIKRCQDNTSISDYIYEIEELTENPYTIKMGNKIVTVFKPDEYVIHKRSPSSDRLKKINIRGSIKEGNSSGRFYMAHIEPLKKQHGVLYKVPEMGGDAIPYRYFLSPTSDRKKNGDYFQGVPLNKKDVKEVPYPNFLDFEEMFNNVGYEGGVIFRNGKKPVDFLKFIIRIGSANKNALILDFFAGSGSTGHAVLEQNSIDGGKRRVILCTNNENNIAADITYTRMKNVINGYRQTKRHKETLFELRLNAQKLKNNKEILAASERFNSRKFLNRYDMIEEEVKKEKYIISGVFSKHNQVKGLGNSLKYYKVDFITKKKLHLTTEESKVNLACLVGNVLAIGENTLTETERNACFQIFESNEKATVIVFRNDLSGSCLKSLVKKFEDLNKPAIVYLYDKPEHSEIQSTLSHFPALSIRALPESLLVLYQKIFDVVDTDV